MSWRELVSTALLGTERRDVIAAAPLEVSRETPEEELLARAAVTVVYRRAGMRPQAGATLLPQAPSETLPRCSPAAALRLSLILGGEFAGVLDEWLDLARARGVRVPEELLPALFAHAHGRLEAVLAVAGERGRWLAGVDDAYAWAASGDDVWETGTLEARRTWLRERRREDPDVARAALAETWPREDPRSRALLLAELATSLSGADEELLEHALDDRRQEARVTAAYLLSRLPASAYARRMGKRARALVRIGKRIDASLPEELDNAGARDVVLTKPPQGTGERAWWLQQIVAATSLDAWDGDPAKLVRLKVAANLEAAVHAGWSEAAARQRNAEWAAALLPQTWEPKLVAAAPAGLVEKQIAKSLDDPRSHALLQELRRPYGLELSRALVRRGRLDRSLALALDPRALDDLPDDAPPGVVQLLAFRHDLHKELA
jgi:Family of unknown function (DUF5691)